VTHEADKSGVRRSDPRSGDAAVGLALLLLAATPAAAEPQAPSDDPLSGKRMELRGVEEQLQNSTEQQLQLDAEIAKIGEERSRLAQTLIEATGRLRETEERANDVEQRLKALQTKEDAATRSLHDRRALVGEVLLVLQRMNRRPPPALLTKPEDILEAIRAAMTIGAVVPQMRVEVTRLQEELAQLVALRKAGRVERADLERKKKELADQQAALEPMIEQRRAAVAEKESARASEAERMRKFAEQATSIKDLLARMERESEAARKAAQAARDADAVREAADRALSREQRAKALAQPFRDPARLAPAVAFGDLKGKLHLPAVGAVRRRYGEQDGYGGVERGFSIATRERGVVTAPTDGWVAYAGSYRSYGQLLIINAGGGYYVVLAGMARIGASVGQFVLAGEPLAIMGDGSAKTAAAIAIGAKQPILYVEFRKDGISIDPGPWWARSDTRKVGG
jgi:septal ring factor EnvC (AmiA/AmiB activator)